MGDAQDRGDQLPARGLGPAINFIVASKVEGLLWLTRLSTVVLTISFLLGFGNSSAAYQRVLLCNAATSALRLHQRMPRQSFSREFIALLLLEDACHYLIFSLIFLFTPPIAMVLLPVFLFALLHSCVFSLKVIDMLDARNGIVERSLKALMDRHGVTILQLVAFTEIFLMPVVIFSLFRGYGSLMTPFIYYRFLSLRYASRRNPYTRNMFRLLRIAAEQNIASPSCPAFIRRFVQSSITYICQLAPQLPQ